MERSLWSTYSEQAEGYSPYEFGDGDGARHDATEG